MNKVIEKGVVLLLDPNEIQTEREPASSKTEKNSIASACFEWMEALIPALIVIMIFFTFVFRVNIVVNGPSMEPNLMDGYKLFTTCVEPTFTRGDIVVIDAKGTSLDRRIVKRVIATEGQTVDIDFHTGIVSVDGMELDESAYIENGITKDEYDVPFPQKVPAGHVFVLGDNRTVSEDSRFSEVGMIDQRYVIGKVKFIIVPFEKFGQL
ncbi:signal peptidase I [Caproiciproducens sp. AGMB10547]|uniref:Signal peptidase I n=1 Tax=Caproiciproducens faecalis TaxID=2820301 RepID=A0ABS7DTV4_9FIRM|nr:signal peptidase I [Caproiciproducens faecalis]